MGMQRLNLLLFGILQRKVKALVQKFVTGLCLSLLVFACTTKNVTDSNQASVATSSPAVNDSISNSVVWNWRRSQVNHSSERGNVSHLLEYVSRDSHCRSRVN